MSMIQRLRKVVSGITGTYDVMAYARKTTVAGFPETDWYLVKPSEIYPATVARIVEAIQTPEVVPAELIDNSPTCLLPDGVARSYLTQAMMLPARAWDLTLLPVGLVPDEDRKPRAQALELARHWFTEAIHNKIGRSIGIVIDAEDGAYAL